MSLIDYPYSSLISQILRGAIIILSTESARRVRGLSHRVARAQSQTRTLQSAGSRLCSSTTR